MVYMKKLFVLLSTLFFLKASFLHAEELKLADFDRGQKPNLISGDYGSWNRTEWDRSQFCNESFTSDPRIVYNHKGCSLALDYDVDSPSSPAYNGFWMRLEKMDLRDWKYLYFYVRGHPNFPYPDKFIVEIKNIEGKIASFLVEGITSEWKKVIIPLDKMNKEADFRQAFEFTIVFDEKIVVKRQGEIFIDEFYLYR